MIITKQKITSIKIFVLKGLPLQGNRLFSPEVSTRRYNLALWLALGDTIIRSFITFLISPYIVLIPHIGSGPTKGFGSFSCNPRNP